MDSRHLENWERKASAVQSAAGTGGPSTLRVVIAEKPFEVTGAFVGSAFLSHRVLETIPVTDDPTLAALFRRVGSEVNSTMALVGGTFGSAYVVWSPEGHTQVDVRVSPRR